MKKVAISKRYYEPIPNETHKAWLAFCIYRDMGSIRSLDKAWQSDSGRQGRHSRHWATWSANNHWVSRSQAYDLALSKQKRRLVQDQRVAKYMEILERYS